MMEFPLAHDENGAPLEVPANAAGWLVRRHGGGRGRPAAVYDRDGRPMVVPLESTAAELAAAGCRPAMYRLDAVDVMRKQLGVTAYTEVRRGLTEDEDAPTVVGVGDAAVAALARAVEAMQRVQAERERAQVERDRVQAELVAKLLDRLGPPAPPAQPRNVSEVLDEHLTVAERIDKMAPKSEGDADTSGEVLEQLAPSLNHVIALISKALGKKLGIEPLLDVQQVAAAAVGVQGEETRLPPPNPPPSGGRASGDTDAEGDSEPAPRFTAAQVEAKLNAIMAKLTPGEARLVKLALGQLAPETLGQITQRVMAISVDQAVAEVRQMIGEKLGGAKTNGTATNAAANNIGGDDDSKPN